MTNLFEKFTNKYPNQNGSKPFCPNKIEKYAVLVPKELRKFWSTFGIGTFMDGYFRMIIVLDYSSITPDGILTNVFEVPIKLQNKGVSKAMYEQLAIEGYSSVSNSCNIGSTNYAEFMNKIRSVD